MDVRIYRGETMYYQTKHERPLIGGYISRPLLDAKRMYRSSPCIAWLMYGNSTTCDASSLQQALADLDVTDVFLDPGDIRGRTLAMRGFSATYGDDLVEVWSIPTTWRSGRGTEVARRVEGR